VPQLVLCEKCGATLYKGMDIKAPNEITQQYDGRCPKCGKRLSFIPKKVEVKLVESTWARQNYYQLTSL